MNDTKPIKTASSSAEMPDKNEGQQLTDGRTDKTHISTGSAGTDSADPDPVGGSNFVDVTDQYIGKTILIVGSGRKAE